MSESREDYAIPFKARVPDTCPKCGDMNVGGKEFLSNVDPAAERLRSRCFTCGWEVLTYCLDHPGRDANRALGLCECGAVDLTAWGGVDPGIIPGYGSTPSRPTTQTHEPHRTHHYPGCADAHPDSGVIDE